MLNSIFPVHLAVFAVDKLISLSKDNYHTHVKLCSDGQAFAQVLSLPFS